MAMASNSKPCYLSILLLLLVIFFSLAQLSLAARATPRTEKAVAKTTTKTSTTDKKETDCIEEGTVAIPGIGGYMPGTIGIPDLSGLDHSIPAAMNGHYLPGADDTFIPNPGFEIPNPFHP